ncbi:MAG: 2-phospho-L-lactate guanylyltransferase [SAR324 cluster bacterium]|nr:2-phospho-L-lactate guanylyltransferase [SAR324 cluster bacterium]
MSQALLIPVKELANAKHRLSGALSPQERRDLAWLMLKGVLREGALLAGDVRKVVVTSYGPAKELALDLGYEVLSESRQVSESDSVDRASAQLEREGVRGVLRVPLDLPLLEVRDLRRVLTMSMEGLASVLVPSADGDGTNALYRAPPCLFPSRFGPGSLFLHEQLAREHRVPYVVEPLESLALDIDDEGDLRALMAQQRNCPAREYLEKAGLPERLHKIAAARGGAEFRAKSDS